MLFISVVKFGFFIIIGQKCHFNTFSSILLFIFLFNFILSIFYSSSPFTLPISNSFSFTLPLSNPLNEPADGPHLYRKMVKVDFSDGIYFRRKVLMSFFFSLWYLLFLCICFQDIENIFNDIVVNELKIVNPTKLSKLVYLLN